MGTAKVQYTYEDYLALGDDRRYEVLNGELIVVPAPSTYHQKVQAELLRILFNHVREHRLGQVLSCPCDVVLSQTRVVQPDILFVTNDRLSIIGDRAVEAGPDLVVEILSPSSRERDRGPKSKIYAEAGVREYWIVDPDARAIEVYSPAEKGFALRARFESGDDLQSDVLPGFGFPVADVFP